MHGPPLSSTEIASLLSREVSKLIDIGVDRDRAVIEVAKRRRISALEITRLMGAGGGLISPTNRIAA